MIEAGMTPFPGQSAEDALRAELAESDRALMALAPVLHHLLVGSGGSLLSEELIARIRGMLWHAARQLLAAAARAMGAGEAFVLQRRDILAAGLAGDAEFLRHVHAMAVEGQLCERLRESGGPDPVLSPLLQALTGSDDAESARLARAFMAAQARFLQNQQRMELPLGELPGELFERGLAVLRDGAQEAEKEAAQRAAEALRDAYDEAESRIALVSGLVASIGGGTTAALSIEQAGVTIFLTALAAGAGQPRDLAVLSTADGQRARLALALSAAGLEPRAIGAQMIALNPDAPLPATLEHIDEGVAAKLLAAESGIG